jgi:hypothetical protein
MSILAQCGYGRGDKIEQGLDEGVIQGVIMSPRDERRDRLEQAINQWAKAYPKAVILFDPQFYAATLNAPRDGHLSEYDYYNNNNGLTRTHFSSSKIQRIIKECLDYQFSTFEDNLKYLVSPTILFDGFNDSWSQVAINFAVEAEDYHARMLQAAQPLLISIVVSETAFQSMDALEEFLDAITEIEAEGFYVIVRRNANFLQNAMEASSLSRFLYFCYVLSEINNYKVIVGYSDWQSFLISAAGADHMACGWYQNLRQFTLARFQPPKGGRRPLKRYSSSPLLSCPLIVPELENIHQARLLHHVLSGSPHDRILANGPANGQANWSDEISCLSHWFSLNDMSQRMARQPNTRARIQEADQIIQRAQALYRQLEANDVIFDPQTGPDHLAEWHDALQQFRGII